MAELLLQIKLPISRAHVHKRHTMHGWKSRDVCSIPNSVTRATWPWASCQTSLDLISLSIWCKNYTNSSKSLPHSYYFSLQTKLSDTIITWLNITLRSSDKHTTDKDIRCMHTISNALIGLCTGKADEESWGLKRLRRQHALEYLLHTLNWRLLVS